jgi:hypothetical protein
MATAVLGAGARVIIYLIFEGLLHEAHEHDTGALEVAVLFAGFCRSTTPVSLPADPRGK